MRFGILMRINGSLAWDMSVYTDADFANDQVDRKSISGYATQIDDNTVPWGSSKQSGVSQSTAEAEYVATNEGTKDVIWLRELSEELEQDYELPLLWCDNMAAVYMSVRPGKHGKTKHVETKFHFVRHLVEDDQLETKHCGTEDTTADIFTKTLGQVKFEKFSGQLNVLESIPKYESEYRPDP